MIRSAPRLRSVFQALTLAIKSEWRKSKIPNLVSMSRTLDRWDDGPRNTYFITSDKGVFRCDPFGLHQVVDVHLYGCTIVGSRVFMGFYVDRDAILVEGRAEGLFKPGVRFEFRKLFSEFTSDTNERLHQITAGGDIVWIARTAAGAALRYETRTGKLTNYTLLRDHFGTPVKRDINHINSVVQYGDVVLFTGTHCGNQSIVGMMHGTKVTAFGYRNVGVHDIYLTQSGFLFFDTFGPNRPDEGGVPVTEAGTLFPEIFSKPPGYVLRGAAQQGDEILIGSSHKGERKHRFKGNGQLLIFEGGNLRTVKRLPCAQVYQIIAADGGMLEPPVPPRSAAEVRPMLERSLGAPLYEGEAHVSEVSVSD
jgi:hypothetical protein